MKRTKYYIVNDQNTLDILWRKTEGFVEVFSSRFSWNWVLSVQTDIDLKPDTRQCTIREARSLFPLAFRDVH